MPYLVRVRGSGRGGGRGGGRGRGRGRSRVMASVYRAAHRGGHPLVLGEQRLELADVQVEHRLLVSVRVKLWVRLRVEDRLHGGLGLGLTQP